MDIDWLQDFLTLAETGNFTRAAGRRHISQAAFSRRIRALEEWLGAELVDRDCVPVRLTPEGERFHAEAGEILGRLLDTRAQLTRPGYGGTARVRIAMPHLLAVARFPGWWESWSAGTGISVNTSVGSVTDIMSEFVAGGSDILICHRGEQLPVRLDPDLFEALVLETDMLRPYARRGLYPFRSLEQLASHQEPLDLILYSRGAYFSRLVELILEQAPQKFPHTRRVECNIALTIRDCIARGMGVGWLPQSVSDAGPFNRLIALPGAQWRAPIEIVAFAPRRRAGMATSAIWENIRAQVARRAGPG